MRWCHLEAKLYHQLENKKVEKLEVKVDYIMCYYEVNIINP